MRQMADRRRDRWRTVDAHIARGSSVRLMADRRYYRTAGRYIERWYITVEYEV